MNAIGRDTHRHPSGPARHLVVSQTIGLLLLCAALMSAQSIPAAVKSHLGTLDAESQQHVYYFVGDPDSAKVAAFIFSSCSLQLDASLCAPQRIQDNLYWIDIRQLKWTLPDFAKVLYPHPYSRHHNLAYGGFGRIIRLDWFLIDLLDTALSASRHTDGLASYYRLLYAGQPPNTEKEFLAYWEADTDDTRHFGQIEGQSQVSKQGRRWIEYQARQGGGYIWFTRDSFALTTSTDPLERPSGDFSHDGTEVIVGMSKFSSADFSRFTVQYYGLFNGAGSRVNEAPVQLVEDYRRFRGMASIRTFGSCVMCHIKGIQPLDENALVKLATDQRAAIFAADPDRIRRFHFGDLSTLISRNQADYEAAIIAHTGFESADKFVEALDRIVSQYEQQLDLPGAAKELGVTEDRLVAAIDTIATPGEGKPAIPLPANLVALAHGGRIPRAAFETQYANLDAILKTTASKGGDVNK
jgi:hypothetical protein